MSRLLLPLATAILLLVACGGAPEPPPTLTPHDDQEGTAEAQGSTLTPTATPTPLPSFYIGDQFLRGSLTPGRYHTNAFDVTIPPSIPDDFGVWEVFSYATAGCEVGTDPQDCCWMEGYLEFFVGETKVGKIVWDRTEDFSPDLLEVTAFRREWRPLLEEIAGSIKGAKFICG